MGLEFLRFAVIGAASGGLYAMLALGLVVVYRSSRVVNFGHAAIGVTAAYAFNELRADQGVPFALALAAALLLGIALGLAVDVLVMRPLRASSPLTRAIAGIGVLIMLQAALNLRYDTEPKVVAPFLPTDSITFAGITVGQDRLVMFVIAVALTLGLHLVYRRTTFGLATSALSENRRSLAALGWSPTMVGTVNWAVGGTLASLAGILLAPVTGLTPALAMTLMLPALAAALLGRLASFPLTLLGGILIGVSQAEIARFTDVQGLSDAVPFLAIMLVLATQGTSLPGRGYQADALPRVGSGRIPVLWIAGASVLTAVLIQWVLPEEWVAAVTTSLIVAIILLSLVVVTGYAGQLSLASFALAGVGALVSAQLVANAGWSFLPAAAAGVLATAPVGLLVGLPAVRTRGISLAVVTLGLAVSLQSMVLDNRWFTNGSDGLTVGTPTVFGMDFDALFYPRRYSLLALVALVALGLAVLNLRRSAVGRRLVAVRANERAAASLGIGVIASKLYAFVVSGMIAAVGGILLAFTNSAVVLGAPASPFDPFNSINAVAQATIGGVGYVGGAIGGTVTQNGGVMSKVMDNIGSGDWLALIGGFLLVFTVVTAPDGVAANMQKTARQLRERFGRSREKPDKAMTGAPRPDIEPVRPAILRVQELTVAFGGAPVLDGVSLSLTAGKVLGVIGPNGAGKTTLIDAVTGYNTPRSGSITLDGEEIGHRRPAQRSRLGVTRSFQSLELFEDLSVMDNLLAAAERTSWYHPVTSIVAPGTPELSDAGLAAVHELGLAARLHDSPGDLSYGERRLLAIARALATRPRVLLLDEPAAGLDDHERTELRTLIRRLASSWGTAVLLVEHDVDLVMETSDEVLALDFGKVIAFGTPEQVRREPAVISAYLGEQTPAPAGEGVAS